MGGIFGKCFKENDNNVGKKKKANDQPPKQEVKQPQKDRITDTDRAILDVKARMKKIKVYIDKLNLQVKEQDKKVKDLIKAKSKDRALIALKHKKFLEKELDKADGA